MKWDNITGTTTRAKSASMNLGRVVEGNQNSVYNSHYKQYLNYCLSSPEQLTLCRGIPLIISLHGLTHNPRGSTGALAKSQAKLRPWGLLEMWKGKRE